MLRLLGASLWLLERRSRWGIRGLISTRIDFCLSRVSFANWSGPQRKGIRIVSHEPPISLPPPKRISFSVLIPYAL